MKFLNLISLNRDILGEGTNPLLLKYSWVQHLVTFLWKRPVVKAIRVTFFIESYIFCAFPPLLLFQILHIFQVQVTQQLQIYPQLQLTYCPNLISLSKGPIIFPNVQFSLPLNGSLLSFVIIIITNELFPLMLYRPCFRFLRSLHFLPWYITSV